MVADETFSTDLRLEGTLPIALSGRLLCAGPMDMLHVTHLHGGRAVSYRALPLGIDVVVHDLVRFGSSVLVVSPGSVAYELSSTFSTAVPVDLAGKSRPLAGAPTVDADNGELHLVTDGEPQVHVVVSRGALTRRSSAIVAAPGKVTAIVTTPTHLVFRTTGFVGLEPRIDGAPVTWTAIGTSPFDLLGAEDDHEIAVTAGSWRIGVVERGEENETDLVIREAADAACVPVAIVHLPRRIPAGPHAVWVPSL